MLRIFSMMSVTLAPRKQKVIADFYLSFFTIESPIISVDGGGAVGEGEVFCDGKVDEEWRTEGGAWGGESHDGRGGQLDGPEVAECWGLPVTAEEMEAAEILQLKKIKTILLLDVRRLRGWFGGEWEERLSLFPALATDHSS